MLAGEVTLVTDAGEELLHPGDAAGFKAGDPDGHCLQNRSNSDALVVEVGTRIKDDGAHYPDIDMMTLAGVGYAHRDGTPYPSAGRRGEKR